MAGSLNKVMLIGNIGADIKIHRFDNGGIIGRLPLATSESYTAKETGERIEQTEWHNLVVRNKVAEIFEKYVKKGDKLFVEGKIKSRKWQGEDGVDRYTTEIIVENFSLLTPKDQSGRSSENYTGGDGASLEESKVQNTTPPEISETPESQPEDDLPF
ncbi:MAG: single-stranded DNA-binding protein [Weeksellaceae bacterium]